MALCVGGLGRTRQGAGVAGAGQRPSRSASAGIFGYHALLFAAFRIGAVGRGQSHQLPLAAAHRPAVAGLPDGIPSRAAACRGGRAGPCGGRAHRERRQARPDAAYLPGYLLAAAAALVWASYSLLTKRLPPFPTGAVGGFCLVSGILSLGLYFLGANGSAGRHARARSLRLSTGSFLCCLGLGPMGGAFYAWDAALKRGDPRVIGALSYLTPLLSTA